MMDPKELGKLGEKMAAEHLDQRGFKILHKNYHFGKAEVDIVAMKDNKVVKWIYTGTRQPVQ